MKLIFKINNRLNFILNKVYIQYLIIVKGVEIGNNCYISRKISVTGLYKSIKIGNNCIIEPNVRLKANQSVERKKTVINIHSNVFIGYGSIIDAGCYTEIGKNSMIGPYVLISDGNHVLKEKNVPIAKQGGDFKVTVIGENVWVGCQSQILKGVTIGSNSIIAANSTVTKSLSGNSLITGIPAIIKKNIF